MARARSTKISWNFIVPDFVDVTYALSLDDKAGS
jgi:hypothetical protein